MTRARSVRTRSALIMAAAAGLITAVTAQPAASDTPDSPEAPVLQAESAAEPVESGSDLVRVEQTSAPSAFGAETADGPAVIQQSELSPFRMAAVSWSPDAPTTDAAIDVRVRTGGNWGDWERLEPADGGENGEEPSSTEPLWTGEPADAIEVRPDSNLPELRIVTVEPGDDTPTGEAYAAPQSSGGVNSPDIISREQWGAAPAESCDATAGSMQGVVLHHTAGANSYGKEESAGIIRGYQSMHMVTNGWCDLGYNFLVDKYGQVFEGRAGSLDGHVRGAHAGVRDVNENTTGVAMLGNFESANIWDGEWNTLRSTTAQLIAWRLDEFGKRPLTKVTLAGATHFTVSGHRNWLATACPGRYGQDWLDAANGLRADVDRIIVESEG